MQPQYPAPAAVGMEQKTETMALAPVVICCSNITATHNTANMHVSCRSALHQAGCSCKMLTQRKRTL